MEIIVLFRWFLFSSSFGLICCSVTSQTDFQESIFVQSSSTRTSFGEDIQLQCIVRIRDFESIDWFRGEERCIPSWCKKKDTINEENNTATSHIVIMNVQKNYTYECVAKAKERSWKTSISIEVGEKPGLVGCRTEPENPQPRSHKVTVTCRYWSKSISTRKWLDGSQIIQDDFFDDLGNGNFSSRIEFNQILLQRSLTFMVDNPYGIVETAISIQVLDRHLNEKCLHDSDCVTPNGICSNNLCNCPSTLPVQNNQSIPNSCLPVVDFGDRCKIGRQCEASDNRTTCLRGQCSCIHGYAKDRDRCVLPPDRDLYVVLGVGLSLLLVVFVMLTLYFYRKRKDDDEEDQDEIQKEKEMASL